VSAINGPVFAVAVGVAALILAVRYGVRPFTDRGARRARRERDREIKALVAEVRPTYWRPHVAENHLHLALRNADRCPSLHVYGGVSGGARRPYDRATEGDDAA